MTNTFNSAIVNEKAKAILDYLNLNGHRFDVNGHFDHQPSSSKSFRLISDESDNESSANDLYQGPVFWGQATQSDLDRDIRAIERQIRTEEEAYRKAEREGYKYDLEKCVEIRDSEMGRCRRRWKDNPLLRLVLPDAYDECMQHARERYGHCTDQHKMPADNPEYGPADANGGAPVELDNRKRKSKNQPKFEANESSSFSWQDFWPSWLWPSGNGDDSRSSLPAPPLVVPPPKYMPIPRKSGIVVGGGMIPRRISVPKKR